MIELNEIKNYGNLDKYVKDIESITKYNLHEKIVLHRNGKFVCTIYFDNYSTDEPSKRLKLIQKDVFEAENKLRNAAKEFNIKVTISANPSTPKGYLYITIPSYKGIKEEMESKKMKYYIGDPCYIMDINAYRRVWGDKLGYKDTVEWTTTPEEFKNKFVVSGTAYGDGSYRYETYRKEQYLISQPISEELFVDAGVIGIVREDLWDTSKITKGYSYGLIFEIDSNEEQLFVSFENNNIYLSIGTDGKVDVVVFTGYDDEQEDDYEEDEYNYDEDDNLDDYYDEEAYMESVYYPNKYHGGNVKRAKQHKRRSKGNSYFLNKDAGNVEHNISVFNHMNCSDTICTENVCNTIDETCIQYNKNINEEIDSMYTTYKIIYKSMFTDETWEEDVELPSELDGGNVDNIYLHLIDQIPEGTEIVGITRLNESLIKEGFSKPYDDVDEMMRDIFKE